MSLPSARAARPVEGTSASGETLVELLITVAIMGIAMVAVFGTIWTSLRVADYHKKDVDADAVVRNFAESMQESTGTFAYVPCATLSGASAYPSYSPQAPNADYSAVITKIEYLTGNSSSQPTWQDSSAGCPSGGDKGAQRITLRANGPLTSPDVRGTETLTIIKRDARGET